MSDITINSSENQEDNQKTTPVTGSLSEPNDSSLSLSGEIFSTWLGRRDSNPRMPGPKPGALPLGHGPIMRHKTAYHGPLITRLLYHFLRFGSREAARVPGHKPHVDQAAKIPRAAAMNTVHQPDSILTLAPR